MRRCSGGCIPSSCNMAFSSQIYHKVESRFPRDEGKPSCEQETKRKTLPKRLQCGSSKKTTTIYSFLFKNSQACSYLLNICWQCAFALHNHPGNRHYWSRSHCDLIGHMTVALRVFSLTGGRLSCQVPLIHTAARPLVSHRSLSSQRAQQPTLSLSS